MNKHLLNNKLLIIIILLAAILRFYMLNDYPAVNADEAALAYNAYSLIETGMDEHSNFWPLHFQSFNDYKPGGYVYIILPLIYLFGMNEWTVRVPGALFGVLTVWFVYLLAHELFRNKNTALFSALLLAISPWHLHFSRGGWEVNVATFFITAGVYFFAKGVKKSKYFPFSMLFWVFGIYTYHAARLIVPLLGLFLLIIYFKKIFSTKSRAQFIGSIIFAGLLLVPLVQDLTSGAGSARATGVSILADRGYVDRINEKRGRYTNPDSLAVKLIHNKPKEIAIEFGKNYFEHFWGEFLFLSGDDIERNKVPEMGQLYLFQAALILFAARSIVKNKRGNKAILAWLLIAPIPAALTFQSPHALRAQSMVIPLTIISAVGLMKAVLYIKNTNKTARLLLSTLIIFTVSWSFSRYVHQYYVHMSKTYPFSSQYALKELALYIDNQKHQYDKIVVTTRYDQPYILYLFYSKYNPTSYQENHTLTPADEFGFSTVDKIGNISFKSIEFDKEISETGKNLIIGTDEEIPENANVIKEIYGENGQLYFQIVN